MNDELNEEELRKVRDLVKYHKELSFFGRIVHTICELFLFITFVTDKGSKVLKWLIWLLPVFGWLEKEKLIEIIRVLAQ